MVLQMAEGLDVGAIDAALEGWEVGDIDDASEGALVDTTEGAEENGDCDSAFVGFVGIVVGLIYLS